VPHPGSHYENGEQPGTHLGGSDFQLAILLHAYPDPQAALEGIATAGAGLGYVTVQTMLKA